ncbi:hypothetical protein L0F63_003237 [Massospora cicadina]|nr:hypothetical protein L0F63_003237 [Massospora cicadina]
MAYNGLWRILHNVGFGASPSIREQAGHNLKSSLTHLFTLDTRNDALLPSCGNYFRLAQELAGLKGDARFFKTEVEYQSSFAPLPGYVCAKLWASRWCTTSFACYARKAYLNSLCRPLFLGGATNVRGFRGFGLGPRCGRDGLGGDLMAAAGASLLTPLPYFTTPNFRGHLFANAGRLTLLQPGVSFINQVKDVFSQPSIAVGVGLVLRHSIARFELNYCIPLAAHKGDQKNPGLQLGLGINFL